MTKAEKVSKTETAPKVIKKRTQTKSVPAKGLEVDDDDESEFDLENELDEEDALNELAEKSNPIEPTTEEDVYIALKNNSNSSLTSSKDLNLNPKPKSQFQSPFPPSQQIERRNLPKRQQRQQP